VAEISVVGLGYVGVTTALGLASLGHSVVGVDSDRERIRLLSSGEVPFIEPGLAELLRESISKGRITFTTCLQDLTPETSVVFVAVPTPQGVEGEADTSIVEGVVDQLASMQDCKFSIAIRSTMPVGASQRLVVKHQAFNRPIVYNPEFLSEGNALRQFVNPDRIVVGCSKAEDAREVLDAYGGLVAPVIVTGLTSAEIAKHAANSLLATRLSFVNELANLCEAADGSVEEVTKILSYDPRIGPHHMMPGPGWGGSCFPKDTREFFASSVKLGTPMHSVASAIESNEMHRSGIVSRLVSRLGGDVTGVKIAVWGLSFKAETNDLRRSPALAIAEELAKLGALVCAFDPSIKSLPNSSIAISDNLEDCCQGARALLVLTEWEIFKETNPSAIRALLAQGAFVMDARRILMADEWRAEFENFWVIGN
jgi:UDPglucose 6-dehydrogenase